MPGNTLQNVSLAEISQRSLETLVNVLPAFDVFSKDFSDEIAVAGQSVTTHLAGQPTSGTIGAGGYAAAAQDASLTSRTVSIGDPEGLVLGFTDSEWSKSNIDLMERFISPGINAIAAGMITKVLALVTAGNFANYKAFVDAFDADSLTDVGEQLTTQKVGLSRGCILNPTLYTKLLKDSAVKNASAYNGDNVIKYGRINQLAGFSPIIQYNAMPEGLNGFAGGKEGLIVVSRVPAVPETFPGEIETVTDPDTGFTIQLRKWYSADLGKYFLAMVIMTGAAVGNAGQICRITYSVTPPAG